MYICEKEQEGTRQAGQGRAGQGREGKARQGRDRPRVLQKGRMGVGVGKQNEEKKNGKLN